MSRPESQPEPITVWQLDGGWDAPSASPFCIKLQAWLRMAGVPYRVRALRGRPRSPTGKIPYIEYPDGRVLGESQVIIETLSAERGVTLDAGLDPQQHAIATAMTRLLEDHFYWVVVWDRWIVPEHWALTRESYFSFVPSPLRGLVSAMARRGIRRALREQGFGRMPESQILARAERDLDALVQLLGDEEHFLGRPTSLDATAFAFLLCALCTPFDGPLKRAVAGRESLARFCERFEARWWPPPSSPPCETK